MAGRLTKRCFLKLVVTQTFSEMTLKIDSVCDPFSQRWSVRVSQAALVALPALPSE